MFRTGPVWPLEDIEALSEHEEGGRHYPYLTTYNLAFNIYFFYLFEKNVPAQLGHVEPPVARNRKGTESGLGPYIQKTSSVAGMAIKIGGKFGLKMA